MGPHTGRPASMICEPPRRETEVSHGNIGRERRAEHRREQPRLGRGAGDREHDVGGGPAARAVRAAARGVPRALDQADHRIPRGGRVLVDHDRRRRARGQPRLEDVLLRKGRRHRRLCGVPAGAGAGDVHRHGPPQARPHQGALPGRLHTEADRRSRAHDPRDRHARARSHRRPGDVRSGERRRPAGRRPRDRQLHGHLRGGRRRLGAADERHARRQRPRPQPRRHRGRDRQRGARDLRALRQDDRRAARAPDRGSDERAGARRDRRASAWRNTRS